MRIKILCEQWTVKYLVADNAWSRERNYDSAEFVSNVTKDFSALGDEVAMMFGINGHGLLNDVVLKHKIKTINILKLYIWKSLQEKAISVARYVFSSRPKKENSTDITEIIKLLKIKL